MDRLERAGYAQYEISNVARPGKEARHNLKYWRDGEWLGFGCGAHSTRDGVRWKNVASTEEYINRVTNHVPVRSEERRLSTNEQVEEALFTGLRLTEGIDLSTVFDRYAVDVKGKYAAALAPYLAEKLVILEGDRLRLSREGMLVANEIFQVFV
jgi:oxygen-independent coproporphyrinogen-3 oxidase